MLTYVTRLLNGLYFLFVLFIFNFFYDLSGLQSRKQGTVCLVHVFWKLFLIINKISYSLDLVFFLCFLCFLE